MGLMWILRKVKQQEHELRLLVLGLDNAGKTTIVKRLKGADVHSVSPTLGFDISTMQFNDYTLNIWDVGGQQTIRAYWRNYFEQTDGIIWVVDSADAGRLAVCRAELEKLLQEERLAGASLLIFANKQDLPDALSLEKIADALGLYEVIGKDRHWKIAACSAMAEVGEGGEEDPFVTGVDWLVADVGSRIFMAD